MDEELFYNSQKKKMFEAVPGNVYRTLSGSLSPQNLELERKTIKQNPLKSWNVWYLRILKFKQEKICLKHCSYFIKFVETESPNAALYLIHCQFMNTLWLRYYKNI